MYRTAFIKPTKQIHNGKKNLSIVIAILLHSYSNMNYAQIVHKKSIYLTPHVNKYQSKNYLKYLKYKFF